MSLTRAVYVTCDECMDGGPSAWFADQARREAKAAGFKRVGNRDLCPRCLENAA